MIRAAAKNHAFCAVVVHPESYDAVLDELREADGTLSMATREALASEAFSYTARYDIAISRWFTEKGEDFPQLHVRAYEKVVDLPYGENPHQRAAFYSQVGSRAHVLSQVQQHGGKSVGFNNILDLDAARAVVRDFDAPACAIVKHNNPCGVATGSGALEAYRRAYASDPLSAYGGVVVLNRRVDRETAGAIAEQFVEVLFAPGFDDGALEVLAAKPNLRILEDRERRLPLLGEKDIRQVTGGLLVQDRDQGDAERTGMEVVTGRPPTERRVARPALRLAGLPAREVQRDRPRPRQRDRRHRRRADEPRRRGPPRRREVAAGRTSAARRWPPTPSSRSPTAPPSRSRPA